MKRSICFVSAGVVFLTGCVGYNSALFMTKTNVGLDVDSKPATLEISLARREGVIAPAFEGGATPPVLASFAIEPGAHVPLFPRISQTFAGGNASVAMASLYGSTNAPPYNPTNYNSTLWLREEPKPKVLGVSVKMPKPGTVKPFVFGTDTSFGLKVAWSGLTAQFPDTVRLGLNRKEFALAPVFLSHSETNRGLTNAIRMPSFLATLDNSTDVGSPQKTSVRHIQYFATGLAADNMALHPQVRQAMLQRLDPEAPAKAEAFIRGQEDIARAQAKVGQEYKDVDRIIAWVKTGSDQVDKAKLQQLIPNTGLNQKWVDRYSSGPATDLETALKGKYRSSVSKLVENIP